MAKKKEYRVVKVEYYYVKATDEGQAQDIVSEWDNSYAKSVDYEVEEVSA